mgnify:CR=1 FL=1
MVITKVIDKEMQIRLWAVLDLSGPEAYTMSRSDCGKDIVLQPFTYASAARRRHGRISSHKEAAWELVRFIFEDTYVDLNKVNAFSLLRVEYTI